jgi:hypothetical protein
VEVAVLLDGDVWILLLGDVGLTLFGDDDEGFRLGDEDNLLVEEVAVAPRRVGELLSPV